jgi:altronate hydrolase
MAASRPATPKAASRRRRKSHSALTRKAAARRFTGLLQPGVLPPHGGLYLIDDTSDGVPRHGFAQLNDSTKLAELAASGAHLILFSTGRGSVIGAAVTPVLKICANPETFRRMEDDMDVDAGRILDGAASLDEVGDEIVRAVLAIAGGGRTNPRHWDIRSSC